MGYYDTDKSAGKAGGRTNLKKQSSYGSKVKSSDNKQHEKEQERQAKEREKLRQAELDFQKEKFKTQQRNRAKDELERTQRERERQKAVKTGRVQKHIDTVAQKPTGYQAPGETFGQQAPPEPQDQPAPQEVPDTNIKPIPEIGKRFVGKNGDWAIKSVELEKDEGSLKAENQETYETIFMNYRNGKWSYKMKNKDRKAIKISSPSYMKVMQRVVDELDTGGELHERVGMNEAKFRRYLRSLIKELIDEEEIDEISQTGAIAGYQSPKAFSGKQKTNKEKMRQNATQLGYELIEEPPDADEVYDPNNPVYENINHDDQDNQMRMMNVKDMLGNSFGLNEDDINDIITKVESRVKRRIVEGRRGHYHDFRDDGRNPNRKMGESLIQVRKELAEIERVIDMNLRLKQEMGIQNDQYWARSHRALRKIEEKLVRIMHKVKSF